MRWISAVSPSRLGIHKPMSSCFRDGLGYMWVVQLPAKAKLYI